VQKLTTIFFKTWNEFENLSDFARTTAAVKMQAITFH